MFELCKIDQRNLYCIQSARFKSSSSFILVLSITRFIICPGVIFPLRCAQIAPAKLNCLSMYALEEGIFNRINAIFFKIGNLVVLKYCAVDLFLHSPFLNEILNSFFSV